MSVARRHAAERLGNYHAQLACDWTTSPIWLAGDQGLNRRVLSKQATWTLGVDNPFSSEITPSRPITFRHLRVFFSLLSKVNLFKLEAPLTMSLREISLTAGFALKGDSMAEIRSIVDDLRNYWVRVQYPDRNDSQVESVFTLIHGAGLSRQINAENRVYQTRLSDVVLHSDFIRMISSMAEFPLRAIRCDVLRNLPTDAARAFYVYLPSRAHHHSKANPFRVRLSTLVEQVGANFPDRLSQRLRFFDRNLRVLDSHPLQTGRKLRISLEGDGRSGSDPMVILWSEDASDSTQLTLNMKPSVLVSVLMENGWSHSDAVERFAKRQPLPYHLTDRLTQTGFCLEDNQRFIELVFTLIPGKSEMVIGEYCSERLNPSAQGVGMKDPAAVLRSRLLEAVGEWASRSRDSQGKTSVLRS